MLSKTSALLAFLCCMKTSTLALVPNAYLNKGMKASFTQLHAGKTIAIFGASGLTSSECVYQALKNGDKVVGLTRNPSKLVIPAGSGGSAAGAPLVDENLSMIQGSVTNYQDVQKVFADHKIDGVIVGLGGKTKEVGDTMLTDGTRNIMSAMKEKGVKRLAVITSIGAGDSKDQAPFFFKILMATAMKKIFNDKNNQEQEVMKSGLEYCIVRPGGLTVEVSFLYVSTPKYVCIQT